jgi:hypothetical protein
MLTDVTIYWLTGTGASSAQIYYESMHTPASGSDDWQASARTPTGVAAFAEDVAIRRYGEASANIPVIARVVWKKYARSTKATRSISRERTGSSISAVTRGRRPSGRDCSPRTSNGVTPPISGRMMDAVTETDPYADVPPPSPDDGPQEPVDWTQLDYEEHPMLPEGVEDGEGS